MAENISDIAKRSIIEHPEHYFNAQKKSLEQKLDGVKLTPEEESEIIKSKTTKTIRDKILGLFKVGEVIQTVLNWNEDIDNELKGVKKDYLLNIYFDKVDHTQESVVKLTKLLTSPAGNTLFNKILRILDNTPPDIELSNHLANVLKNITNSDFEKLFSEQKFALSQIEQLSPQALTILTDNKNWPIVSLQMSTTMGTKIVSEWYMEFTRDYGNAKSIHDHSYHERIIHSINELINNRFIEAHKIGNDTAKVTCTNLGTQLIKYLT
ncbi:hypothetical protein [Adhaeribacter aquaticus]|uniref:hypothetical protein n=1 Tax=Adhaeribacter aquaticus TaxID=299567 RepID=UPI00041F89F7|nr:hypothetical protein [Adhaeribacter aquaticus]